MFNTNCLPYFGNHNITYGLKESSINPYFHLVTIIRQQVSTTAKLLIFYCVNVIYIKINQRPIHLLYNQIIKLPEGGGGQSHLGFNKCILTNYLHNSLDHPGPICTICDSFLKIWSSPFYLPAGEEQSAPGMLENTKFNLSYECEEDRKVSFVITA